MGLALIKAVTMMLAHLCAARFNQTNPLFGPVFGGGPTLWMGGTAPSFYDDHLFVVTGRRPSQPCCQAPLLITGTISHERLQDMITG